MEILFRHGKLIVFRIQYSLLPIRKLAATVSMRIPKSALNDFFVSISYLLTVENTLSIRDRFQLFLEGARDLRILVDHIVHLGYVFYHVI